MFQLLILISEYAGHSIYNCILACLNFVVTCEQMCALWSTLLKLVFNIWGCLTPSHNWQIWQVIPILSPFPMTVRWCHMVPFSLFKAPLKPTKAGKPFSCSITVYQFLKITFMRTTTGTHTLILLVEKNSLPSMKLIGFLLDLVNFPRDQSLPEEKRKSLVAP